MGTTENVWHTLDSQISNEKSRWNQLIWHWGREEGIQTEKGIIHWNTIKEFNIREECANAYKDY